MCPNVGDRRGSLPFPGKYNVYNALAAAATGLSLGMELTVVLKAIETVKLPLMRMEKTELRGGTIVINDAYNAANALR